MFAKFCSDFHKQKRRRKKKKVNGLKYRVAAHLTSTGLYRSCAALASFSGTFDLILFQAVIFELIVEKVWFGLVWIVGSDKQTK